MPRLRSCAHSIHICLVVLTVLLLTRGASGRLGSIPDIGKLTTDSNLVAVVEVVSLRQLGPVTFTDQQRHQLQGQRMAAVFRLEEVFKGETSGNSIEVQYDSNPEWPLNSGPVTPGFLSGSRMIVFLRCEEKSCTVTNTEHAGFPVEKKTAPVPEPPDASAYHRVLQRIACGLFRDNRVHSGKSSGPHEVFLLANERDPYVTTLFRAALEGLDREKDFEFRGELLAALVRRGDTAALPQMNDALFSGMESNASTNMILALQQIDWHESLPIAARALRLPSASLRMTAAEAIQYLRVQPPEMRMSSAEFKAAATTALLSALHDPDPQVAFAVMQSLGSINGRLDRRPTSFVPTDAQWMECLHFWETFSGNTSQ